MSTTMIEDSSFLELLAGMLTIAGFTNWLFMGLFAIQVFIYLSSFPEDRVFVKLLVFTLSVLEICQTALVSRDIYFALVPGLQEMALGSMQHHWVSIPIIGGISGSIGQLFFAYRIYMMSQQSPAGHLRRSSRGSKVPSAIIATLAFASLGSALAAAAVFFRAKTFAALLGADDGDMPAEANNIGSLASIGVWNGLGAVCDIIILLSMPYYLMRNGTGMRRTHIRLVGVVRLVIETGFVTTVIAILHLCLYFGSSPAFLVPGLTLSKIYANTTLLLLNNRKSVRDAWNSDRGVGSSDIHVPETPTGAHNSAASRRLSRPSRPKTTIVVSQDRLTIRMADPIPVSPKAVRLAKFDAPSDVQLDIMESKLSQGTTTTANS